MAQFGALLGLTCCIIAFGGCYINAEEIVSRGKRATQSSIGWSGSPERAVDGNANQNYWGNSCTHTNSEQGAWWQVDLEKKQSIETIRIYNRQDCCSERLSNFKVLAGPDASSMTECAVYPGKGTKGQIIELKCRKNNVRYVKIQLNGNNYLTLCEVEVIASPVVSGGKPASQSSIGWSGSPERAVDGNTNQIYWGNSCTHTNKQQGAWWQVDLEKKQSIEKVVIYNREDCCSERLSNFKVMAGPDAGSMTECATFPGTATKGQIITLKCRRNDVRFVRIQLNGNNYLTLCEVEVYKTPVVSRGKIATQSSVGWSGVPARGVDGNTNQNYWGNSCTHTNKEQGAWWQVDLENYFSIDKVKIYNREDCCSERLSNFKVLAGPNEKSMTECALFSSTATKGQIVTLKCQMDNVRFVKIQLNGNNYLTLCEVEVFERTNAVSRGKIATQSSVGWSGIPARGVDGDTNQNYFGNSCTHTNSEQGAWWQVNLEKKQSISKIALYNRKDCCSDRLSNFKVLAGPEESSMTECATFPGKGTKGEIITLKCEKENVQYVKIQLNGKNYLTLCEVEVFA